jgi:hypothetical protein
MRKSTLFSLVCFAGFAVQAIAGNISGGAMSTGGGSFGVGSAHGGSVSGGAHGAGHVGNTKGVGVTQKAAAPGAVRSSVADGRPSGPVFVPKVVAVAATAAVTKPCPENLNHLKRTLRQAGYHSEPARPGFFCPPADTVINPQTGARGAVFHCLDMTGFERLTESARRPQAAR